MNPAPPVTNTVWFMGNPILVELTAQDSRRVPWFLSGGMVVPLRRRCPAAGTSPDPMEMERLCPLSTHLGPHCRSPPREGNTWRATALAILWFATLTGIFFAPFLLRGRTFLPADFLHCTPPWYDPSVAVHNVDLFDAIIQFQPFNMLLHEGLQHGLFPAWNPYNFGGHPLAADGQSGMFYPPRLALQALCSPTTGHDWLLVLHTFAAGVCMFGFCRRLGQSTAGALLAGTTWMFNGFATTWLEMEFGIVVSAGLVATLWMMDLARERLWATGAAAVAFSFLLVGGHLQPVLYAIAIIMGVMAWRLYHLASPRGALLRVAAALTLGVLLAAPMLLPTLQVMHESQRPTIALSYEMAVHRQFLSWFAPTLVVPDALGTPVNDLALVRVREGGYFVYCELCAYCGLVPLLLALVGAAGRGMPRAMAITALLVLLVPATPLYAPFWVLPGLSRIIVTRVVFIWAFAVAVLSGFGVDRLELRHLPRMAWAAVLVLVGWGGAVVLLKLQSAPVLARNWIASGALRLPNPELHPDASTYLSAVEAAIRHHYAWDNPSVWMPLAWAGLVLAWALAFQRLGRGGSFLRWRPVAVFLLTVLAAVDLVGFGTRFNSTASPADVFPPNPTTEFLQRHSGEARVMGLGTFKPDTLLPAFVQDVGGYDSFYPREASEYLAYMERGILRKGERLTSHVFPLSHWDSPMADLLGVRYFVAYPHQDLAGLPLAAETPLRIYENPRALPRCFEVTRFRVMPHDVAMLAVLADRRFNAREEVLLDTDPGLESSPQAAGNEPRLMVDGAWPGYPPTKVEIASSGHGPRLLVLTDTFAPGWVARVDSREVPILRADYMFRAVAVPAGSHRVVFSYEPAAMRLGLLLAAGALCVVAACLALGLKNGLLRRPVSCPRS